MKKKRILDRKAKISRDARRQASQDIKTACTPAETAEIPPPTEPLVDELPFDKLSWVRFQDLCRELVSADPKIRSCHNYGKHGQKQWGIDLIAYSKNIHDPRPLFFQCKNEAKFGPSDIQSSVNKFLKKNWKLKPREFVIICRCSLDSTQCQNEIMKQTQRLSRHDILFDVLHGGRLSDKLRDHPKIVRTYFGMVWVRAFCGREAEETLTRRFEPSISVPQPPEYLMRSLLSKDEEIRDLKSSMDVELSNACDLIKREYQEGRVSLAFNKLQSYLERFQTDLHGASRATRARFWYTAGVLNWGPPGGRQKAKDYLDRARQIDSDFDLRPLEARLLFYEKGYEEALRILEPVDSAPVFTLRLALLLDIRRTADFDALWAAPPGEPDDTAYRLLAYRERLDRRFAEAREAIQKAISLAPNYPDNYVAAGHIIFWEAVPVHLDESPRAILPIPFHFQFYRPTPRQALLLDEALGNYRQAIDLLKRVGAEASQVREIEEYQFHCLAYHPQKGAEADEVALRILAQDPARSAILLCCLEKNLPFDLTRSIQALQVKCSNGEATPVDIQALVELYESQGDLDSAIRLMEAEAKHFATGELKYYWTQKLVELLVKRNTAQRALEIIESYPSEDPVHKLRLEALFYDRSGNEAKLEKALIQLHEESPAILDLVNLCGFYRKAEWWGVLETHALELLNLTPDPFSLSCLALALFHNGKLQDCVSVLDKHTGLFLDSRLPDHLQRIRVDCLFKLNRFQEVIPSLEMLAKEKPSSEIIQGLAGAYLRTGQRKKATDFLVKSSRTCLADPELKLATAQLLLQEDPEAAFELAQTVWKESTRDPNVWLDYIGIGFRTGHDRESRDALLSFEKQFPGSPLLKRVSFEEFLEVAKESGEQERERWNQYRHGKIPVHLLMDTNRDQMGSYLYRTFLRNKKIGKNWTQKSPLLLSSGYRRSEDGMLSLRNADSVLMDYTALLLAHYLDLLPLLEQAFSRIYIPPSLLVLLQEEIAEVKKSQPSLLHASQVVKDAVDSGKISVLEDEVANQNDLRNADLSQPNFLLFRAARQHGRIALAMSVKTGGNEQEYLSIAVSPRELLLALHQMGDLSRQELDTATTDCTIEPCREDMISRLAREHPPLITDSQMIVFLVEHRLLDRIVQYFELAIPASDRAYMTDALQESTFRQNTAEWLDTLLRHITTHLDTKYSYPSLDLDDHKNLKAGTCTILLREIFHMAQKECIPLWIEDRLIQGFEKIETAPIVTITEILTLLTSKGLLSPEQSRNRTFELLDLNMQFLTPSPEMVLHFLREASLSPENKIVETYELRTIRKYIANAFGQHSALNPEPPGPEKFPEAFSYLRRHQTLCCTLLTNVWSEDHLSDEQRMACSDWTMSRLWRGTEEILPLFKQPHRLSEVVVFSHYLLLTAAFDILFQGLKLRKCASAYVSWLYDHYLRDFWRVNPEVENLVLQHLVEYMESMAKKGKKRQRLAFLVIAVHLLTELPHEMRDKLIDNENLRRLFKDYLCVRVSEELEFPADKWREWAFECMSTKAGTGLEKVHNGSKLSLQWQQPDVFSSGLNVQFVSKDGISRSHTVIDPFLQLHHPAVDQRKECFEKLLPYLAVSSERAEELRKSVAFEVGRESVVNEIEVEANSSWGFFWEKLAHSIRNRVQVGTELLFPEDPEVFARRFQLSPDGFADCSSFRSQWATLVKKNVKELGFSRAAGLTLSFPFGGDISASAIVAKLIDSGDLSVSQVLDAVREMEADEKNPVILQNCLDLLLTFGQGQGDYEGRISVLIQRLLGIRKAPDLSLLDAFFSLYVTALRFCFSQMESIPAYQEHPLPVRILWTYAYATALTEAFWNLESALEPQRAISSFADWLSDRVAPSPRTVFGESFTEHLEVSHPERASLLRTVIFGTLGILSRHGDKLKSYVSPADLVAVTRSICQGSVAGSEDIFRPFQSVNNYFGSPFGENVFHYFRRILTALGSLTIELPTDQEQQYFQFIQEFDLQATLQHILNQMKEKGTCGANELIQLVLILSEPLDPTVSEMLKEAISCLALSSFSEETNFTTACTVLSQSANASNDTGLRGMVLDKLKDAWLMTPRTTKQYAAIMQAALLVFATCQGSDAAAGFSEWLASTVENLGDAIPQEVYELIVRASWVMPLDYVEGLLSIKSRLAIIL